MLEKLNEEILSKVNGGDFTVATLYVLNNFVNAAYAKYDAWYPAKPDATIWERLAMAESIFNETYEALDDNSKQIITEFKTEQEAIWKEMIKEMAGVYNH